MSAIAGLGDTLLAAIWIIVLGGGLGFCVLAHRLGLATTYVRDLLHIGTSVWVFGLRFWRAPLFPIALTMVAFVAVAAVPFAAARIGPIGRFRDAVSDGDERFDGLVLYTFSYAALTAAALLDEPVPAAAALLSLAWGDGVGGLVGRHLGRVRYRVPGAKTKSLEGSLAVALLSGLGVIAAAAFFGRPVAPSLVVLAAVVAAVVEAVAPRASDNVLLPLAVWIALRSVL